MARFPAHISPGGNSTVAARLKAGTLKHAFAPRLAWSMPLTWRQLHLLPSTQGLTVLVGGTASDGDYVLTFSGGGLAAPVAVTAVRDSGETSAQMAVELEAAIATARATTLAGVVTDESVATATITIVGLTKAANVTPLTVVATFPGAATATLEYTYVTTIVPSTDIGLGSPYEFFTNMIRGHATVNRKTAFAGATAITAVMGDAGAANGLLTSTSLASTGIVQTTGAAERVPRFEAAFVPQIQVTLVSVTPLSNASLTAGEAVFEIHCHPVPEAGAA